MIPRPILASAGLRRLVRPLFWGFTRARADRAEGASTFVRRPSPHASWPALAPLGGARPSPPRSSRPCGVGHRQRCTPDVPPLTYICSGLRPLCEAVWRLMHLRSACLQPTARSCTRSRLAFCGGFIRLPSKPCARHHPEYDLGGGPRRSRATRSHLVVSPHRAEAATAVQQRAAVLRV